MRTFLVSASFVGNFQDNRIIGLGFWSHKDCASIHDSRLCPYQDAVTIINPVHRHQPRVEAKAQIIVYLSVAAKLSSILKTLKPLRAEKIAQKSNAEARRNNASSFVESFLLGGWIFLAPETARKAGTKPTLLAIPEDIRLTTFSIGPSYHE